MHRAPSLYPARNANPSPEECWRLAWEDLLADLMRTLPEADRLFHNNLAIAQVSEQQEPGKSILHYRIAVTRPDTLQRLQRMDKTFKRGLAISLKQEVQVTFALATASVSEETQEKTRKEAQQWAPQPVVIIPQQKKNASALEQKRSNQQNLHIRQVPNMNQIY